MTDLHTPSAFLHSGRPRFYWSRSSGRFGGSRSELHHGAIPNLVVAEVVLGLVDVLDPVPLDLGPNAVGDREREQFFQVAGRSKERSEDLQLMGEELQRSMGNGVSAAAARTILAPMATSVIMVAKGPRSSTVFSTTSAPPSSWRRRATSSALPASAAPRSSASWTLLRLLVTAYTRPPKAAPIEIVRWPGPPTPITTVR